MWHWAVSSIIEDNPPPHLLRSIQWGLAGTQYAKGRYAVHKNPVISKADIKFSFKKVQFLNKKITTNVTYI